MLPETRAAQSVTAPSKPGQPTLIILGTGFAAFSVLESLDEDLFRVIVVSPRNHFLFTPLLPSTTVGTVEFRSIIEPIRSAHPDVTYYDAACTGILHDRKVILCHGALDGNRFELAYDLLVIAVGAVNNTFGVPGVREHALFLKELADARAIRQRIIDCFEQASQPGISEQERTRLLQFVVVGGGPTGVEFAAEMHDFIRDDLRRFYPAVMPHVRIILLEALEQILGSFDASLSEYTIRHFRRQQIDVRTKSQVMEVKEKSIALKDGPEIPCGLIVWSTGTAPTELVQHLPFAKEKNRIVVNEYLQIREFPEIYAIGDCSIIEGTGLPMTAQVAEQAGKYLGKALTLERKGKTPKPFHYRHTGMLAYIGSERALADLERVKARGYYTWLFWRSAYLTKLVSFKNKVLVLFDWMKTRVFGRDISRF